MVALSKADLDYLMTEQAAIMSAHEAFDLECKNKISNSSGKNMKYMTRSDVSDLIAAFDVWWKVVEYKRKRKETKIKEDCLYLDSKVSSCWKDERMKGFVNKKKIFTKYVAVGGDLYRLNQNTIKKEIYKFSPKDFDMSHGTKVIPIDEAFNCVSTIISDLEPSHSIHFKTLNALIGKEHYGISQDVLQIFLRCCEESLEALKTGKNMISDSQFRVSGAINEEDRPSQNGQNVQEDGITDEVPSPPRRAILPRKSKKSFAKKRKVIESSDDDYASSVEDEAEWKEENEKDEEPPLEVDTEVETNSSDGATLSTQKDSSKVNTHSKMDSPIQTENGTVTDAVAAEISLKIPRKTRIEDNNETNDVHLQMVDAVIKAASKEVAEKKSSDNHEDSSKTESNRNDGNVGKDEKSSSPNSSSNNGKKDKRNDESRDENNKDKMKDNKLKDVIDAVSVLRNNRNMWSIVIDLFLTNIVYPGTGEERKRSYSVFTLVVFDLGSGKTWFKYLSQLKNDVMGLIKEKLYELFCDDGWPVFVTYVNNGIGFNMNRYQIDFAGHCGVLFEFDEVTSGNDMKTYVEENEKDVFMRKVRINVLYIVQFRPYTRSYVLS